MPLSIGIVRDELPREHVSVTIGLLSAIFGIGAGVGIVAAGPIVENLSWHWLFWLPLVLDRDRAARRDLRHARVPDPQARPPRPPRHRNPDRVAGVAPAGHQRGPDLGLGRRQDRRPARARRCRAGRLRPRRAAREGAAHRRAAVQDPRRVDGARRRPRLRLRDVRHLRAGPDPAAAADGRRLRLRQVGLRGGPLPAADRRS